MNLNTIYNEDCLELMKRIEDNSIDLIVTDPPYALGSEVIIRADGKPDYKKAVDFMDKWTQPDGKFWEEYFKQAMRILKYGGRVIMFSMDRQNFVNKYYACFAGFQEQQSLYWYFISNFPKSTDLSKMIAKRIGEDVYVFGSITTAGHDGRKAHVASGKEINERYFIQDYKNYLSKKYEGLKYSISPTKQTNETILIFQKPYKNGSCLNDVFAYESGDKTITVGTVDIEGNRVGINGGTSKTNSYEYLKENIDYSSKNRSSFNKALNVGITTQLNAGRFPSQTFCNSEAAECLDRQSGISKASKEHIKNNFARSVFNTNKNNDIKTFHPDKIGGCSKILHVCDYDAGDFDLYNYAPKVSPSERGSSTHVTMKPLSLMKRIIKYFKTPNPQIILDTFCGSGSTLMACKMLGIDFIGVELNPEYCEIAQNRINSIKNFDKKDVKIIKNDAVKTQIKNELELF